MFLDKFIFTQLVTFLDMIEVSLTALSFKVQ